MGTPNLQWQVLQAKIALLGSVANPWETDPDLQVPVIYIAEITGHCKYLQVFVTQNSDSDLWLTHGKQIWTRRCLKLAGI